MERQYRISRFNRGNSAVFNRPCYGTRITCTCKWTWKINEPPSGKGTKYAVQAWKEHTCASGTTAT